MAVLAIKRGVPQHETEYAAAPRSGIERCQDALQGAAPHHAGRPAARLNERAILKPCDDGEYFFQATRRYEIGRTLAIQLRMRGKQP